MSCARVAFIRGVGGGMLAVAAYCVAVGDAAFAALNVWLAFMILDNVRDPNDR